MTGIPEPWLNKTVGNIPRLFKTASSDLPIPNLHHGVPASPVLFCTYPLSDREEEFLLLSGCSRLKITPKGWDGLPDIMFYEVERRIIKELMRLGIPLLSGGTANEKKTTADPIPDPYVMKPPCCEVPRGKLATFVPAAELLDMAHTLGLSSSERSKLINDVEYRVTLVANLVLTHRLRDVFGRYIPVKSPSPLDVIKATEHYCAAMSSDFGFDKAYVDGLKRFYKRYFAPIFPEDISPIPGAKLPSAQESDYADKPINFPLIVSRFEVYRISGLPFRMGDTVRAPGV